MWVLPGDGNWLLPCVFLFPAYIVWKVVCLPSPISSPLSGFLTTGTQLQFTALHWNHLLKCSLWLFLGHQIRWLLLSLRAPSLSLAPDTPSQNSTCLGVPEAVLLQLSYHACSFFSFTSVTSSFHLPTWVSPQAQSFALVHQPTCFPVPSRSLKHMSHAQFYNPSSDISPVCWSWQWQSPWTSNSTCSKPN